MSKYIYTGKGENFPGLPANDLDDAELDDAQKILLKMAVEIGLYAPEKDDHDQPATQGRTKTNTGATKSNGTSENQGG